MKSPGPDSSAGEFFKYLQKNSISCTQSLPEIKRKNTSSSFYGASVTDTRQSEYKKKKITGQHHSCKKPLRETLNKI